MVTIAIFRHHAIIAEQIPFRVGREEGHPRCAGILNARIEPIRRLSHACRADHKGMDITGINQCDGVVSSLTADHNALFGRAIHSPAPFFRFKRNMEIHFPNLPFRCPTSRSVLSVSDCSGFDVEAVQVRQKRDAAENQSGNCPNQNNDHNTGHPTVTSLSIVACSVRHACKSSLKSLCSGDRR